MASRATRKGATVGKAAASTSQSRRRACRQSDWRARVLGRPRDDARCSPGRARARLESPLARAAAPRRRPKPSVPAPRPTAARHGDATRKDPHRKPAVDCGPAFMPQSALTAMRVPAGVPQLAASVASGTVPSLAGRSGGTRAPAPIAREEVPS